MFKASMVMPGMLFFVGTPEIDKISLKLSGLILESQDTARPRKCRVMRNAKRLIAMKQLIKTNLQMLMECR